VAGRDIWASAAKVWFFLRRRRQRLGDEVVILIGDGDRAEDGGDGWVSGSGAWTA